MNLILLNDLIVFHSCFFFFKFIHYHFNVFQTMMKLEMICVVRIPIEDTYPSLKDNEIYQLINYIQECNIN